MAAPVVGLNSAAGGNVASLILNKPADAASDALVGEMCFAVIATRNTITVSTVPTNWTLIDQVTGSSSTLRTYRHKYIAGDPTSWTWTLSGTERAAGCIFTVTGADSSGTNGANCIDSFTGIDSTLTTPSVNTQGPDRLLIHAYGVFHSSFGSTATLTTPASTTLIVRNQQTNCAAEANWEAQAAAGATATRTATTNTSQGKTAIVTPIKAAPSGALPPRLTVVQQSIVRASVI